MFLNIFKTFLIFVFLFSAAYSEGIIFKLPDGWEKSKEFSESGSVLVFAPKNSENPLIESLKVRVEKNNIGADKLLWDNLIGINKKYPDFRYYKILYTPNEAMGLGCSTEGGFCTVQRIVKQGESSYIYSYLNTRPHYSQGFFGKWTNICAQIKTENELSLEENEEFFEL